MERTLDVPIFRVSRTIVTDKFDALYKVWEGRVGFVGLCCFGVVLRGWGWYMVVVVVLFLCYCCVCWYGGVIFVCVSLGGGYGGGVEGSVGRWVRLCTFTCMSTGCAGVVVGELGSSSVDPLGGARGHACGIFRH